MGAGERQRDPVRAGDCGAVGGRPRVGGALETAGLRPAADRRVAGAVPGGIARGRPSLLALLHPGHGTAGRAVGVRHRLRTQFTKQVAASVAIGVAVPALAWGAYDISADPLTYDWSPPIANHELVASYMRAHTNPKDRVLVWGDWPALYEDTVFWIGVRAH